MKYSLIIAGFALSLASSLFGQEIKGALKLSDGFEIQAFHGSADGVITYSSFRILHHNRIIYTDTTDSVGYFLKTRKYPMLMQFSDNVYQLLILYSSPPAPYQARLLGFRNDHLFQNEIVPEFEGPPKDLARDGSKEYAGVLDLGEEWQSSSTDTTMVTSYNPILYYRVTPYGIALDSALTIRQNRMIYGKFYGFELTNDHPISVSEIGSKFGREYERIIK
ncbi:MAG: hypothetical protein WAO19_02190 [Candidatus Kryptoniota bacterium]